MFGTLVPSSEVGRSARSLRFAVKEQPRWLKSVCKRYALSRLAVLAARFAVALPALITDRLSLGILSFGIASFRIPSFGIRLFYIRSFRNRSFRIQTLVFL